MRSRPLFATSLFAALALAGANGCFIATDDFGKPCRNTTDCPRVSGYLCASSVISAVQQPCAKDEKGCQCEVKFPPDPVVFDAGAGGGSGTGGGGATGGGAGGGAGVDAGPPPDYCDDIKPIINLSCISTCHGDQMGYPNSPTSFRLDRYHPIDGGRPDGGVMPGLYSKADRVKERALDKITPMPPLDFPLPPTAAQRNLIARWVDAGAPRGCGGCDPGEREPGCPPLDAGTPVDAGISFSASVRPIFQQRCGPCHTTNTSGGLSLTAANAYQQLIGGGGNSTCNAGAFKRVVAFDPKTSLLWLKLTPDGGQRCGNPMPPNGDGGFRYTFPTEFNAIERWIIEGAKNN